MKTLLSWAIILLVGTGAFAQGTEAPKPGALGLTASVAGGKYSIGLDWYVLDFLVLRPEVGGSYTNQLSNVLNSNNYFHNSGIARTDSTTETFGGTASLTGIYEMPVANGFQLGFGVGGGYQYQLSKYTDNSDSVRSSPAVGTVTSYDSITSVITAGITADLKYFLTSRFAFFTGVGVQYNNQLLTYANMKNIFGDTPSGTSPSYTDSSSYSFSLTTPALGAIFYLN